MRVAILGPLEVEHDGRPVAVGGGRLRALLARLALDAGRPVTTGRLVDAVWEDELPADHVHALQSLVSRLRRSLGSGDLVAPAPGGYRLAVESDALDAHRFERLAAAGGAALAAGDPEQAARQLDEALGLWRGPALADVVDYGFAAAAARRLEDLRLGALADRAEAELALGHGDRRVGELEALTAEHPLHERLAGQLIAALYAAGRQADALAAYERVRARLADELGVAPSPELQAVHLAVLRGDPALPSRRAATSGGPARRTNLPAPVTSFVGREREIEEIGARLQRGRLVTLIGAGGAGKTRLAREALAGWVDRVPGGAWMVELAPVTAEVEVVPAVLGALGLREPALIERRGHAPPREGLERLLDALAEREAIVVLDNCEHLVASVAELVEALLARCPRLRVVATSREPLAIAGESLVAVPPLGLPAADAPADEAIAHPAVRLFADRAAAAAPGFAVDGATVGAVVEVCRRLDGLPLALELAAARLRSLPVEQLAARLGDRFRLLTGGSRTALPRHRTLRAVVDWSWDLLTEPERRLARRLAVFAAGATVDGAAAVAADPGASPDDVLDGLAALVDRSLLQVVPGADPPRFRMLETIREYGLERLAEAGELAAVRDAHARWCADLVATAEPRLRGPEQVRWFQRLEAEREDVLAALRHLADAGEARAALALAVRLLWYWMLTGSPDEAIAWLGRALAVPGDADPLDRTIAEGVRSLFELGRGNADSEEGRARLGALSEALAGADDRGRPLVAVAKVAMPFVAGDPEEAERRLTLARAHPDPWVRATLELFAGGQAENDGDLDGTRAHLEAAVAAYRELGDRWGLAMALTLETGWLIPVGQLDRAEAALVEARAALDELDSAAGAGLIDLRLAEVALRRGDPEAARERVRRALDLLGGRDDRALAEATLARASWHAGDLEGARAALAAAAQQVERLGRGDPDPHAAATAEAFAARVELAVGDPAVAERWLAEAHGLARRTADMPIVAAVGVVAAAAAAHRGRAGDAAELLGGAAALRGADDATNPDVAELAARLRAELGEDAFAAAHARGRALHREDALALLAAASRPAPVGP